MSTLIDDPIRVGRDLVIRELQWPETVEHQCVEALSVARQPRLRPMPAIAQQFDDDRGTGKPAVDPDEPVLRPTEYLLRQGPGQ